MNLYIILYIMLHCHCYSPINRLDAFLSDQNEKCDDDPPLFDEKNTVAGDNLLLAEQRHPQAAKTMRWMWKEECLKNRDPKKCLEMVDFWNARIFEGPEF